MHGRKEVSMNKIEKPGRIEYIPILINLMLFGLIWTGCNPNTTSTSGLDPDTRKWVKAAYDSIDVMKIAPILNVERAAILKEQIDREQDTEKKVNMSLNYAVELLRCGRTEDAISLYNNIAKYLQESQAEMDSASIRNLYMFIGITYMRQGEIQNCVQQHNHASCLIPIRGEGIHTLTNGSENAVAIFENSLKQFPNDLETQYLLNIAYMTLGKYPDGVPPQYRIDPKWFSSGIPFPHFEDIAPQIGVNRQGHAGGTVIDDFNNDGWLDIVCTSWTPTEGLVLYLNNGDGTFTDKTEAFKLDGQMGSLNLNQTDFNNDGWLDLFIMRGAWLQSEGEIPNTLLQNNGDGTFSDVTLHAGFTKFAPTQASAWADFNLDGWLDLVIANESIPGLDYGIDLYINQHDGTFRNESTSYGLTENAYFKGCTTPDVNKDGYPDLYLSNLYEKNSLYINQGAQGKATFIKAGPELNVGEPKPSFPCWSFDYDNDGNEDIFVSGYTNDGTPATHWMLSHMGKADPEYLPKLYHNNGDMTFTEVGRTAGLNEIAFTMGCNFGDINSDGFLDFYLSTGNPAYQSLVPNKMYLNMAGKRFEDVSYAGGFANIQKGHGVSFGDLDRDGDEDLYVCIGGAFDGDGFYNSLYENPNADQNHWIVLKLAGQSANAAAIGARVIITVTENGQDRQISRTVSSGASFGANSLLLETGIGRATAIQSVRVKWPCKDCAEETFTGFDINKAYLLKQGTGSVETLSYTPVKMGGDGSKGHQHHM
mgnify:CR=1 FL=1